VVSFTDLTTGPVTSWNWDFGDGEVSTRASPTKLYTVPGTYTVFLRVSGPGGLDIERKFDLVQAQ
jgi:PKD repeat protein